MADATLYPPRRHRIVRPHESHQLAVAMTNDTYPTIKDADVIVRTFFEAIAEALIEEDRVEIRGFSSFSVREYGAYTGRNPRTGELVEIGQKRCRSSRCRRIYLIG